MKLSERVVQLCLFLDGSDRYHRAKSFFYALLQDPRARAKRYFDLFMILLVLTSVAALIWGVEHPLTGPAEVFEDIAVTIFIVEYLMRLWTYSDAHKTILERYAQADFHNTPFSLNRALWEAISTKWEYIRSPMAIIDLLAILPSYRPLRVLRIFLLFRLFKLFRYARSVNHMADVIAEKRFELFTLGLFMAFVLLTASSSIYIFEADVPGSAINSIFDALYWSLVTLSTVGYGDITPHTTEGRVVTLILILSGIGVLAFTTSIVVSAFQEKFVELRRHRVLAELERSRDYTVVCGYGRVGQVVVEKLAEQKERFIIVEQKDRLVQSALESGYLAVQGNASQNSVLEAVGIHERARTVLCLTGDDVTDVYITITARQLNPDIRIIALARRKEVIRKLTLAGADHVVAPFEVAGLMGAEYVGRPVAFDAIYGILRGEREVILEAVRCLPGPCDGGLRIGDIDFTRRKLILFGVITACDVDELRPPGVFPIRERNFYFNPPPDHVLKAQDTLLVFGHEYGIQHLKHEITKGRLETRTA